jgi:hypothetical protein
MEDDDGVGSSPGSEQGMDVAAEEHPLHPPSYYGTSSVCAMHGTFLCVSVYDVVRVRVAR